MRREICGGCGAPINDDGTCDCTELLKRGWRQCAVGQKTTQWCAEVERVRGELREQKQRDEALLMMEERDEALLRDRLSASAAGAGQAGQPTYSELLAQRDELAKALRGMLNIVDDSCGVAGYHLNGNVADWGEFEEVDAAGAALSRIKGETTLAASHLPAGWRKELERAERLTAALRELEGCEQPANDEVVFIDGVGAGRSSIKSCRDGVQWIMVGDRVYWPLSDSDAKRLQSACCGNGHFDGPSTHVGEGA